MRIILAAFLYLLPTLLTAQTNTRHIFYFEAGGTKLVQQSTLALQQLLDSLPTLDVQAIDIVGYADATGKEQDNLELSNQRALTIANLLKPRLAQRAVLQTKAAGAIQQTGVTAYQPHRKVEVIITILPPPAKPLQVTGVQEDAALQTFEVDPGDTIVLTGKSGTVIKIPPHALTNKKGKAAEGKVTVQLQEYYTPEQIILAGLNTRSGTEVLQTGGMLKVTFLQNGDTLPAATLKPVEMKMPAMNAGLKDMNVFQGDNSDSTHWRNTESPFQKEEDGWTWGYTDKLKDFYDKDHNAILKNMRVGRTFDDECNVIANQLSFRWGENPNLRDHPVSRKVMYTFTKLDSAKARVTVQVTFRGRGYRRFGMRQFDTAFTVNYIRPQYVGLTNKLNWINCDRFVRGKKINLQISTPGFAGMTVMLYFKDINAYLPATYDGKKYTAYNVPANMPVNIIAMGKVDGQYYYGNSEATTQPDNINTVSVTSASLDQLKGALKML